MPKPTTGPTAITLKPGRVFVFAWLLQARADYVNEVSIDSMPVLSLIHGPVDYADALRRSRTSIAEEWPEFDLISHTCYELLNQNNK